MSKFSAKELEKGVPYCTVRWSNHNNNVNQFLATFFAEEKYTDVVIACEGQMLKAHKMILAGCSPYFEVLFNNYDSKIVNLGQPICIVLDGLGISYPTLQLILEFMYGGEIRVKKTELESLVKGGVKLKVKGLDAVKLSDKLPDKPNEIRTVIGRSEVKPPPMAKLAPVTRPSVTPRDSSSRKRVVETAHRTPTSPKQPAPKGKSMIHKPPQPQIGGKTEPPDTDKVSDQQTPQEISLGLRDEQGETDSTPQEDKGSTNLPVASQPEEPPQPRRSNRSRSVSRSRSSSRGRATRSVAEPDIEPPPTTEEAKKVPVEPPTDTVESDQKSEETEQKSEEGVEENGDAEVDAGTVSKRRTIKKPARLADVDFIQEIKIPPMKKRKVRDSPSRKQLAEENAESTPSEEPVPAEPVKRRKGVFSIFCQEFREAIQTENPGDTYNEITRRLSSMWKNLDASEKEKYCYTPKANKK